MYIYIHRLILVTHACVLCQVCLQVPGKAVLKGVPRARAGQRRGRGYGSARLCKAQDIATSYAKGGHAPWSRGSFSGTVLFAFILIRPPQWVILLIRQHFDVRLENQCQYTRMTHHTKYPWGQEEAGLNSLRLATFPMAVGPAVDDAQTAHFFCPSDAIRSGIVRRRL